METTLHENGNTYKLTYKPADQNQINPELNYFTIGSQLFEVVSKVRTNAKTITPKMSLDVINGLDENTKISLYFLPDLISGLSKFNDDYSKELLTVFCSYQDHKDFSKMHKDLETVTPNDGIADFNRWDLETRLNFLECIYPATNNN